jgi:hypothetical protein
MRKFQNREELKNILTVDFWHYYRLNKTVKPKVYKTRVSALKGVRDIFKTMQEMLYESHHGASIKGLGVIVPNDIEVERLHGIFKTEVTVYGKYKLFFEKEYLSQYYKVTIKKPVGKTKNKKLIRIPRPYAVMLHRKKIRKN